MLSVPFCTVLAKVVVLCNDQEIKPLRAHLNNNLWFNILKTRFLCKIVVSTSQQLPSFGKCLSYVSSPFSLSANFDDTLNIYCLSSPE